MHISTAKAVTKGVIIGVLAVLPVGLSTGIVIACLERDLARRQNKNKMEDPALVNVDKSVVSVLVPGVEGLRGQVQGQTPAVERPTGQVEGLINTRSSHQDDTSVSDIYPTHRMNNSSGNSTRRSS